MKSLPWKVGVGLAIALSACAQGDPSAEPPTYEVLFEAHLIPTEAIAEASIQISQTSHALRSLDLNAPASRYTDFTGDGEIKITNERVEWFPPESGGTLRYRVTVDRLRGGVHDTRLTDDWGVFRLDQLFPRANARTVIGAESRSTLALSAVADWSFETAYGPANDPAQPVDVSNSERRFDRPLGWAVAGRLGIRRDRIDGRSRNLRESQRRAPCRGPGRIPDLDSRCRSASAARVSRRHSEGHGCGSAAEPRQERNRRVSSESRFPTCIAHLRANRCSGLLGHWTNFGQPESGYARPRHF